MKRLLIRFLKAVWRASIPVRQPLARRFDEHVEILLDRTVQAPLRRVLDGIDNVNHAVHMTQHAARSQAGDVDLALNSLTREVARLQMQVEVLQQRNRETTPLDDADATAVQAEGGGRRSPRTIGHPAHTPGARD